MAYTRLASRETRCHVRLCVDAGTVNGVSSFPLRVIPVKERLDHADRLIDDVRRCIREAAEGGLDAVVAQPGDA